MSSYRFTILHERFNYTIWRTNYVLKVNYPICNSNFQIVFIFWLIISLTFLELDIFGLWPVTTVTVVTSEKWRTLSVKHLPCSEQDFFSVLTCFEVFYDSKFYWILPSQFFFLLIVCSIVVSLIFSVYPQMSNILSQNCAAALKTCSLLESLMCAA